MLLAVSAGSAIVPAARPFLVVCFGYTGMVVESKASSWCGWTTSILLSYLYTLSKPQVLPSAVAGGVHNDGMSMAAHKWVSGLTVNAYVGSSIKMI